MFESLFKTVVERISSGKRYEKRASNAAFTRQLADAIRQLLHSSDNCDKLGLPPNPSKEEINKAYHRLARLLHPDKNVVPGGEEAFKVLVGAKSALLKSARS
ncbi:dnaJ homolog subfamily C member 27-like [Corticium candelabrum]|uniref:dnaJ homolog subfamily C member 27-like n=1 Tax=Corticium candelabrum TaxID=121492 RepID=UPI002E262832|nr:dnaJ homolog subfamily C member 27-like [Corticium candelabrum]